MSHTPLKSLPLLFCAACPFPDYVPPQATDSTTADTGEDSASTASSATNPTEALPTTTTVGTTALETTLDSTTAGTTSAETASTTDGTTGSPPDCTVDDWSPLVWGDMDNELLINKTAMDSEDNYVAGGRIGSVSWEQPGDAHVIKFNHLTPLEPPLETTFVSGMDSSWINGLTIDKNDNSIYVSGSFKGKILPFPNNPEMSWTSKGSGGNFFIAKLTSDLKIVWFHTDPDVAAHHSMNAIAVDTEGNVGAVGSCGTADQFEGLLISTYKPSDQSFSDNCYPSNVGFVGLNDVVPRPGGGFLSAGAAAGVIDLQGEPFEIVDPGDAVLIWFDATGSFTIKPKTLGGPGWTIADRLAIFADSGDILMAGELCNETSDWGCPACTNDPQKGAPYIAQLSSEGLCKNIIMLADLGKPHSIALSEEKNIVLVSGTDSEGFYPLGSGFGAKIDMVKDKIDPTWLMTGGLSRVDIMLDSNNRAIWSGSIQGDELTWDGSVSLVPKTNNINYFILQECLPNEALIDA